MIPCRWSLPPGWTTSSAASAFPIRARDLNGIYAGLAGCFSTSVTIASMSTCPWVIQSVLALKTRRTMSSRVRKNPTLDAGARGEFGYDARNAFQGGAHAR